MFQRANFRNYISGPALSLALLGVCSTAYAAEPNASHKRATEELLEVLRVDSNMHETVGRMVEFQVRQRPELAPYQKTLNEFYEKYISYPVLKDELIELYAGALTEAEIKQTIQFYKSPTGQKIVGKLPELYAKGGEIGLKQMQSHLPELQAKLQAEMAKNAPPSAEPAK